MSQVSLIVKLVAAEGKRADLATAFSAAYDHVAKEEGTRYYLLHEDMGDANVLWIYEMYESQDAQAAPGAADWVKPFQKSLAPFIGGPAEFHGLKPVGGKGL
ncbi:MAG: putative quinol monooxygenase [Actinomycetota bacterium]